ncbi:MAG: hypothetical protein KF696_01605 [Planctomycetes bacterium]|nr:hypothetical protein [Planctomycetota bacterium]MCW8134363.1 hypothetical protein [Planctomycetota bacterium]
MKLAYGLLPLLMLVALTSPAAQEGGGDESASLPWDKAEVYAAMPWGMVFTYDVQEDGKPKRTHRLEVVPVDDWEVTTTRVDVAADGTEKREKARTRKWERHLDDLLDNFKSPTVSKDELTIGDTKYACKLFTATRASGHTVKAWFSKDVPGAWLRYDMLDGEKVVTRYTLASKDTYWVALPWKLNEVPNAMKDGATFKYKLHTNSGAYYLEMQYSLVTDEGYFAKHSRFELEGDAIGQPATGEVTWVQHWQNFLFLKSSAKVTEAEITVGNDKLECLCVAVETAIGESKRTRQVWFSKKHSGLMVRQVSETKTPDKSNKTVWELVEFKYGK